VVSIGMTVLHLGAENIMIETQHPTFDASQMMKGKLCMRPGRRPQPN
jgi:hypothetical protein